MTTQRKHSSGSFGSFTESTNGLVHLVTRAEYTLCGDALEGDTDSFTGEETIPECYETKKKTVTCPICIEIIEMCRGVKTKWKKVP